jgi:hypothetical protein
MSRIDTRQTLITACLAALQFTSGKLTFLLTPIPSNPCRSGYIEVQPKKFLQDDDTKRRSGAPFGAYYNTY